MTTTTRHTPLKHGERRCYLRGCRRPECVTANVRYLKQWRLSRARGHRCRVDTAAVRTHITQLRDAGWSQRQIAKAAACGERRIGSIHNCTQRTVRTDIADAILAIPAIPPSSTYLTDPTGTVRRAQALAVIGWPIAATAREAGIRPSRLNSIVRGEAPTITTATALAVAGAYRRMVGKDPGEHLPLKITAKVRAGARRRQWLGPLAWGDIDDPNAKPDVMNATTADLKRDEVAALRRDEIWLLKTACIPTKEIAARVGLSPTTVDVIRAELNTGRKRDRRKAAA